MTEVELVIKYVAEHPQTSAAEIGQALNISRSTVFRSLKQLVREGKITKIGQAPHLTYALPGVVKASPNTKASDPPLFSFQITNPVTYLKRWWGKVMANEGVDFHLKIRPITAIAMVAAISSGSFVLARVTVPEPIVKYIPQLAPSPSPNPWREAAYTGTFKNINNRYYLSTGEGESIILDVPSSVNIPKILNRRILATGQYNTSTKILKVTDATDMEVLPIQAVPVPTTTPSPSPTLQPTL